MMKNVTINDPVTGRRDIIFVVICEVQFTLLKVMQQKFKNFQIYSQSVNVL